MYLADRGIGEQGDETQMDITGIAKSYRANSTAMGREASGKEWKLSDSLREKITERLYGK